MGKKDGDSDLGGARQKGLGGDSGGMQSTTEKGHEAAEGAGKTQGRGGEGRGGSPEALQSAGWGRLDAKKGTLESGEGMEGEGGETIESGGDKNRPTRQKETKKGAECNRTKATRAVR